MVVVLKAQMNGEAYSLLTRCSNCHLPSGNLQLSFKDSPDRLFEAGYLQM